MNVINVGADHATTERALFPAFYGEDHDWDTAGWREVATFSSYALRTHEWAEFLSKTREVRDGKDLHHVFKTPLWRSALKLDTDDMLRPVSIQKVDVIGPVQTFGQFGVIHRSGHSSLLQRNRQAGLGDRDKAVVT